MTAIGLFRSRFTRFVGGIIAALSLFFASPPVYAQSSLLGGKTVNQITILGIPIFSLTVDQLFSFIAGSAILIPLTLTVLGILIFLSTLLTFHHVPRDGALVFGWNTMKKHKLFFIGITAVYLVISSLTIPLLSLFERLAPFSFRYSLQNFHLFSLPQTADQTLFTCIGFIFSTYITAGVIRVSLDALSDGRLRFSRLFISLKKFLPFLIGSVIYTVILWTGLIFLIVPGIIFASTFFFWQYRYLEGGKSVIASFQDSYAITRGARKEVFLFWYLSQVIAILGYFAVGVGYLLSYPVSILSLAFVYHSLKKRSDGPQTGAQ